MVLKGSLIVTVDEISCSYGRDQIFVIYPYVPHMIQANESYTLLSLCISKNTPYIHNIEKVKVVICEMLISTLGTEIVSNSRMEQLIVFDFRDCIKLLK